MSQIPYFLAAINGITYLDLAFTYFNVQVLKIQQAWSKCRWTYLDGHNDKTCSVDTTGLVLVSGSKDTTCKVWERSGSMTLSLGDHTSTVSGVFLVDDKVVTTSYDCKLRIWDKASGNLQHTHYLFSPITYFF